MKGWARAAMLLAVELAKRITRPGVKTTVKVRGLFTRCEEELLDRQCDARRLDHPLRLPTWIMARGLETGTGWKRERS